MSDFYQRSSVFPPNLCSAAGPQVPVRSSWLLYQSQQDWKPLARCERPRTALCFPVAVHLQWLPFNSHPKAHCCPQFPCPNADPELMQWQEQSAAHCPWPQGPALLSALLQAFCPPSSCASVSLLPGVEDGANSSAFLQESVVRMNVQRTRWDRFILLGCSAFGVFSLV